MPQQRSYVEQFCFAIGVIALAALSRWGLDTWLGNHLPYVTFFVAIAVIAFYTSTRITAISILGAWVVTDFLFVPPRMSFIFFSDEPAHILGTLTYFVVTGATLATAHGMHRARQQVVRTQARKEAVLLSALDCVIAMDHEGRIVDFNPAAERTFGYKHSDVIGRAVADIIIPPRLRQTHWEGLRRYLNTGEQRVLNRRVEMPAIRADGSEFPCELSILAIEQSDQAPLFTAFLRDISERKRSEAELHQHQHHLEKLVEERTNEIVEAQARLQHSERMATMGTLSAGLGHDIGNILMPIRVHISRIKSNIESPDAIANLGDDFTALDKGFDYLANLASSLRLLARDPKQPVEYGAQTDLTDWCREIDPLLRAMVAKSTNLICRIPTGLPPVAVSKHLLTQAIFNLVQNAAQALQSQPEGTITLCAAGHTTGTVRISVTDNGPGMTEEVRAKCLEPFFTTKPRSISSGLGLAVVNGIIKNIARGELHIDSKPGIGTTFSIILHEAAKPSDAAAKIRASISIRDARKRAIVSTILSSLNCEVEHAPAVHDSEHTDAVVIAGTVVPIGEFTSSDLSRLRQRFQELVHGMQEVRDMQRDSWTPLENPVRCEGQ